MRKLIAMLVAVVLVVGLVPSFAFAATSPSSHVTTDADAAIQSLSTQATAKSATKKMRKLYKKVLVTAKNGTGKFKTAYKKSPSMYYVYGYVVFDIDKNGTPELLVWAGGPSAYTWWHAFTMKSGKVKYLGKFGDGQTILSKGKGKKLYAMRAHGGTESIGPVKLKSGKVKWKVAKNDTDMLNYFPTIKKYTSKYKISTIKAELASSYSAINKAKVTK